MATTVSFGKRIESADINQVISWLKGTASFGDAMSLTAYSSSSSPTLTLRNQHASGTSLLIKNDDNTLELMRATTSQVSFLDKPVAVGTLTLLTDHIFGVFKTNGVAAYQMLNASYTHTGNTADVGASRFIMQQSSGGTGVNIRAGEFITLKQSGDLASMALGLDVEINSSVAGGGAIGSVGMWIHNFGTTWGTPTPQAIDTGILIGADQQGFTNYILCRNTSGDNMFDVLANGTVDCGTIRPLATNTYSLGSGPAVAWAVVYSHLFLSAAAGSAALPAFASGVSGENDNGMYFPATNSVALSTAGTNRFEITATGNVVLGAQSAVGTTATDGFAYLPAGNGVPTGTPTAITGKVAFYFDANASKAYIYNGGWVILN
jgi:hypothetical protein